MRVRLTRVGVLVAVGLTAGHTLARVCWTDVRPSGIEVEFDSPVTRMSMGSTRAIAFHLRSPAEDDIELPCSASDSSIEILRGAKVFKGERQGFVRVRAIKPGSTQLLVGGAGLRIEATESKTMTTAMPRITGPATMASVWGTIAVSVELTDLEDPARGYSGELLLRLSDGRSVKAVEQSSMKTGPERRAVFEVDTDSIRSASLEMEPVWVRVDGTEVAGEPARVSVVHPSDGAVISGEAEKSYDIERPKRFTRAIRRNAVREERTASGGKYLDNSGSEPAMCFPLKVDTPGFYQMVLTAKGVFAGGALPTVGVVVDGAQYASTNGRVPSESWRRFAVGVPVMLSAGDHVITPYYENDFYAAKLADRNLYLDKLELLRVADAKSDVAARGSGADAMMSMAGNMSAMGMIDGADRSGRNESGIDLWALSARPVRVGFTRPLDGRFVGGQVTVEGQCWWEKQDTTRAPAVTLLVNDKPIAKQWSASPKFQVDAGAFRAGTNSVQLVAELESGARAITPVQHVMREPWAPGVGAGQGQRMVRLTVHEPGWSESVAKSLMKEHNPSEQRAAGFFSNTTGTISLDNTLAGKFEVWVESFGQEFQGPPKLAGSIVTPSGTVAIGEAGVTAAWSPKKLGEVELKAGEKTLAIAFTNDAFEEGKGDRNVWFQAVTLKEIRPADMVKPAARIVYPAPAALIETVDAVVAYVADDVALKRAELLLDGASTGVTGDVSAGQGRVTFPLVLRGVEEGAHAVSVRVTDVAGNTAESERVGVQVGTPSSGEPARYARAVKLLNRFGFGPEPDELGELLTQGEEAWLRGELSSSVEEGGDAAAHGQAVTRFPNGRYEGDVSRRVVLQGLITPKSARTRFVMWTENHFSTWARKTEGDRKWREHVAFAKLGAAPFFDLLMASATSPAMLRYLDQEQSYANKLNENYAREIMELHTLGVHGGYSQQDVTSLARLLTGWTTAREGDGMSAGEMRSWDYKFDPALNDGNATRVIGVEFPQAPPEARYDRIRFALEMLAAHPSTATFVCRKLVEHYVAAPAPEDLVKDMASVFMRTGGDMTEVLVALSQHPSFTRADLPARLAHPLDYAVRIARVTRNTNAGAVAEYLQRSGNGMYDRSTPDGYPEADAAYVDSNALLQRWRFAQDAANQLANLAPEGLRYGEFPKDSKVAEAWMQQVVDLIAVKLTGQLLSDESNTAAMNVMRGATGTKLERIQQVAPLIAQLPEASLR